MTWPDDWTVVTEDGKRSAQFEHTMLVTNTGVEVLISRTADSLPFFWELEAVTTTLISTQANQPSSNKKPSHKWKKTKLRQQKKMKQHKRRNRKTRKIRRIKSLPIQQTTQMIQRNPKTNVMEEMTIMMKIIEMNKNHDHKKKIKQDPYHIQWLS